MIYQQKKNSSRKLQRKTKPRFSKTLHHMRKKRRSVIHIKSTLNNTIVTVTDLKGKTICWSSAGACGFKGARKSTPFAAQMATENAARTARERGIRQAIVITNGPGAGRESAVRAVQNAEIGVLRIRDITPIPHNGCRPPKKRRV